MISVQGPSFVNIMLKSETVEERAAFTTNRLQPL